MKKILSILIAITITTCNISPLCIPCNTVEMVEPEQLYFPLELPLPLPQEPVECAESEVSDSDEEIIEETEKTPYSASESLTEVYTEAPKIQTNEIATVSNDVYYIANVMAGECYIFEHDDMMKVGMTICNRVDDSQFPNSFSGVTQQSNQMNYASGRNIDPAYYAAAQEVYDQYTAKNNGEDVEWIDTLYWNANPNGGTTNVFH